jgi:hypothetical protein
MVNEAISNLVQFADNEMWFGRECLEPSSFVPAQKSCELTDWKAVPITSIALANQYWNPLNTIQIRPNVPSKKNIFQIGLVASWRQKII